MRYCRNCDCSYSSDFTFCPKCATRLMSEAEAEEYIREWEAEANQRNEEERLRREDKEMCARLWPILEKYKDRGIYEAISSSKDMREIIRIADIKTTPSRTTIYANSTTSWWHTNRTPRSRFQPSFIKGSAALRTS